MTTDGMVGTWECSLSCNLTVFIFKTNFLFIHSLYHLRSILCASKHCPKEGISQITNPFMKIACLPSFAYSLNIFLLKDNQDLG